MLTTKDRLALAALDRRDARKRAEAIAKRFADKNERARVEIERTLKLLEGGGK